MPTDLNKIPNDVRFGNLLVSANIVNPDELYEAMEIASSLDLPIGKVLVMSGYIDQTVLQAAVQIQSMLRDKILQTELAMRALKLIQETKTPLSEALHNLGWTPPDNLMEKNRLGELLSGSGIVSDEDLQSALETALETDLPLGRILYSTGKISDSLLWSALNAQVMVRDGKLGKDQAINALKAIRQRQISLEIVLQEQNILSRGYSRKIKLGEILVLSGFLSQEILMTALEVGLIENLPLGQILVDRQIVTKATLEHALTLQNVVELGQLTPVQAADVLKLAITNNIGISQAVAELGYYGPQKHETVRLGELLKLAGLMTENDIQEALRLSTVNENLLGKILVATGQLDELILHASLHCQFMLREGFLKEEQAVIALNYCNRMRCSFNEALNELGWTELQRQRPKTVELPKIKRLS